MPARGYRCGDLYEPYALIRCPSALRSAVTRSERQDPRPSARSLDEALTQEQYDGLTSQAAVAEHLRTNSAARAFAQEQLTVWERWSRRLSDGRIGLVVTQGGNIELPAVLLATRLGSDVGPLPLTYCEGVAVEYAEGAPVALRRLRSSPD